MHTKKAKKNVYIPNQAALDSNAVYISRSKPQWWLGHKWSIRTHGSARERRCCLMFMNVAIDAIRIMGSANLLALIIQLEFPASAKKAEREADRLRKRYDLSAFKTAPLGDHTPEENE